MDESLGRALADVRRAVALAHALPRCLIALQTDEGKTMHVGFRRDACVQGTPCDLRDALCLVLAGLAPERGFTLLDRPLGRVGAQLVVEDDAGRHVGLGLYRYRSCEGQGFVFASLAPVTAIERRLRDAIGELRAGRESEPGHTIEYAEIRLVHDPEIVVSLVFVEYPPLPLLVDGCAEEQAAITIAAGCLAEELTLVLAPPDEEPGVPAG